MRLFPDFGGNLKDCGHKLAMSGEMFLKKRRRYLRLLSHSKTLFKRASILRSKWRRFLQRCRFCKKRNLQPLSSPDRKSARVKSLKSGSLKELTFSPTVDRRFRTSIFILHDLKHFKTPYSFTIHQFLKTITIFLSRVTHHTSTELISDH